jgi:hypothetical protein
MGLPRAPCAQGPLRQTQLLAPRAWAGLAKLRAPCALTQAPCAPMRRNLRRITRQGVRVTMRANKSRRVNIKNTNGIGTIVASTSLTTVISILPSQYHHLSIRWRAMRYCTTRNKIPIASLLYYTIGRQGLARCAIPNSGHFITGSRPTDHNPSQIPAAFFMLIFQHAVLPSTPDYRSTSLPLPA